jgi:hypothetical protein
VKWYEYDYKSSTWEPIENLYNTLNYVSNFERFMSKHLFLKKVLDKKEKYKYDKMKKI